MALSDLTLQPDYDRDTCPNIVEEFYAPVLAQADKYDRTTFTFSAGGLAFAARGLESFVERNGEIRLICDRSIDRQTLEAIKAGRRQAADVLREQISPSELTAYDPDDLDTGKHLKLLTWMVAQNRISIKIAYMPEDSIFHDKTGIMTDAAKNTVAFTGSLNETAKGWTQHYESITVFSSWKEPERIPRLQERFDRLWHNHSSYAHVEDIPEDYAAHLRNYAPDHRPTPQPEPQEPEALRHWRYVDWHLRHDPASTVATVPTRLWPHQRAFFDKHAKDDDAPVRKLVADEVGLGKTSQAASLLKWRINQGKATRFLILTPANSRYQWQDELYERFNIPVPVMERQGRRAVLISPDGAVTAAPERHWTQPQTIVSYTWVRHEQQAQALLEQEAEYDLIIVDEAHHARYEAPENRNARRPNQYLELLNKLTRRTRDLLLLTATPMQTAAADLWALLNMLEPDSWTLDAFERLYDPETVADPVRWDSARRAYLQHAPRPDEPLSGIARIIWSDHEAWVRSQTRGNEGNRRETVAYMRRNGPASRLISRHTRELLKEYHHRGYDTAVPERSTQAVKIGMTANERALYDGVKPLVKEIYEGRPEANPQILGFINTTFHTRVGSSFTAYAQSLRNQIERHYKAKEAGLNPNPGEWQAIAELETDEQDDQPDTDDNIPATSLNSRQIHLLRRTAETAEELAQTDSKFAELLRTLSKLEDESHKLIIVFTQFRDTQAWLDGKLSSQWPLTCLHGDDRRQYTKSRAARLEKLRQEPRGLLLCTESASESLNLQFCTAVVNYDIPWNPMRLEQRIGRIDRIGQLAPEIKVVNLYYEDTAEWQAYQAMERRLSAITQNVGPYRPILDSRMPDIIKGCIAGEVDQERLHAEIAKLTNRPVSDLDEWHHTDITAAIDVPLVDSERLAALAAHQTLMPKGWTTETAGIGHWRITSPDDVAAVVTTDAERYNPDEADWFGPGGKVFETILVLNTSQIPIQ